jgi:Zn-dependent peptidase ImmA (M78 family)
MRQVLGISLRLQLGWRNRRTALASWIAAVERAGVLVLHAQRIELDEMRGFSISADELPGIVLDGADTLRGRVFTVLHELAHVLLNPRRGLRPPRSLCRARREGVEIVCSELSAASLLPKDAVLAERAVANPPRRRR